MIEPIKTDQIELRSPKTIKPKIVSELIESITKDGLREPILVVRQYTGGLAYKVWDGDHRVVALKKMGVGFVNAIIQESNQELLVRLMIEAGLTEAAAKDVVKKFNAQMHPINRI